MSVDKSEENILLKIKKAFVLLVPVYTATRLNLAVELLLLLSFFRKFTELLKTNFLPFVLCGSLERSKVNAYMNSI